MVQSRLNHLVLVGVGVVDHVVGHDAEFCIAVLGLYNGVAHLAFFGEGRGQRLTDLLHVDLLVKRDVKRGAAGELNAVLQAFRHQAAHSANDQQATQNVELGAVAHEVGVDLGEPIFREFRREANRFLVFQSAEEYKARKHNGREERGENTDDQRGRETADGATTEAVQNECCQQRGDVGVNDGAVGFLVPIFQCHHQSFAASNFFTNAFVDEYVGVNCHTDGQHDTGNARQCQRCSQRGEGANQEEQVGNQSQVGHQASPLVIENHVEENHHQGNHKRAQT